MAEIDVVNLENKKVGKLNLNDEIFVADIKSHLLHAVVRMQLMNRRGGNASTKGRSEVRGGGAKPWRQKGTGRARAGTSSSPVWVGGGTVFGPTPKKYSLSLNKKVRKAALRSALSLKLKNKEMVVVEDFNLPDHKTKGFVNTLKALGAQNPLIVSGGDNNNLDLSSKNVKGVKLIGNGGLNVVDMLNHGTLILTKDAVEKIEEVLAI